MDNLDLIEILLCGLPVFLNMQIGNLIFLRNDQKTKCFTVFFCMLAMVDVMGIYHAAQITTPLFGSPLNTLMYNDVVKDQIKGTVTNNAHCNRKEIRTFVYCGGNDKQNDGRYTEDNSKPVIFLQRVVVHRMMRFVPYP